MVSIVSLVLLASQEIRWKFSEGMSFTNATLEDNSTSSKDGRPSIHPQMEQIVFPYLSVRSETFRGLEKLRSEVSYAFPQRRKVI